MKVYLRDKHSVIGESNIQTKVDSTIFEVVNKIASQAVGLIESYTARQREPGEKDQKGKEGKITLTKESLGIAPYVPPVF